MDESMIPENVTIKEMLVFRQVAGIFLRHSQLNKTKIYYAAERIFKRLEKNQEKFTEVQQDLQRDHAMIDPVTKSILKVPGKEDFQYDKDGLKNLQESLRKESNKVIVGFEPKFVSNDDIPEDLSFEYVGDNGRPYKMSHFDVKSAFEKFIIKPEED